jgi:hypothetical protein
MCDQALVWSQVWDSWQHNANRSIYCPGKTSSIAMPEPSGE